MSDINVIVNDQIVNIDVIDTPVLVNVVNSPGVPGAPGVGVPVGGTTGQVLAKSSNANYATAWVNVSGGAWGTITGTLSNQTDLQNALNAKFDDPTGTTAQYLRGDGSLATFPAIPSGTVTSVGLTMPSAFSVANSPITTSGTLAVTGAGTASQYIRGDGQLANFPDNGGGGSSVNYYLNGSVNQGTFGGDTYYEMSKTPILGAGTNFTRTNGQGNGYIASFITDAGDPSLLNIPGGNWNLEFYFASSASGGSPQFYGEIYKVSSSNVFTLVASGSSNPEGITNGTTVDQYFTSIPVPQTSLLVTDRLAVRIYVITSGRTITLHTEDGNLCEVLTTLSTGLNALNGLTSQVQYFATGTSGTDFGITSATDTHTFNLPTASSINRGALSSADWTTFNNKVPASRTLTINGVAFDLSADRSWTVAGGISGSGASGQVAYWTGTSAQSGSNNLFWDAANSRLGIGTNSPAVGSLYINNSANNLQQHLILKNSSSGSSAQIHLDLHNDAVSTLYSSGASLFYCSTTYASPYTSALGFWNYQSGPIVLATSGFERMRITAGGNLAIGSTTDSGERLQVTGTMKVTGASSFGGNMTLSLNQNAATQLQISNTTSGTNSVAFLNMTSNSGNLQLGKRSAATTSFKFINALDGFIYTDTGHLVFLSDGASGEIKMAAGGSSTAHLTIASTGKVLYAAATTSKAQINLESGTAPTSPVNGDIWFDGTDIKMRIGGVTKTFTLV
jgi:hypothetical protein